jgi:hypothetical protein
MRVGWKAATSDQNVASYRFRALRPVEALKQRGHDVEVASLDRIDSYDAVVFSKSYRRADHQLARSLKAAGKRVIFDLCDNHFYNPYNLTSYRSAHAELVEMISLADLIVCSTPALARVLVAESGTTKPVSVIGDAADLLALPQRSAAGPTKSLLWFGSHGSPNAPCGMNDLLAIEPLLRKLSREHDFRLVVCSNNRSKFDSLKGYFATALDYAEWSLETFPALLADAEAVVIPLSRNPFVNCKTHNRVSTALGAGVPVIADAIESYREFAPYCTLDDWEKGLREVLGNPDSARARARPAREYLLKHWSMEQIATQWETALSLSATSAASASEQASATPNEEPATARQPDRIIRRYQGAMDPHLNGSVTGWVVQPLDSARPLEVVLKIEGKSVARDIAQRRRSDLEVTGFRSNNCGFSLKVPAEYCDDEEHPFEIIADGSWVVESGERRFGRPLAVEKLPEEVVPEPVVERPRGDRLKSALALATATLTDNAGELASVALQKRLFSDLEQLNAAVDAVRRIAARMILSAADHSDPVPQQVKIHPRERHGEQDPASPRSLS